MLDSMPNHCGASLAKLTQHLTPPVLPRQELSADQPGPLFSILLWVCMLVCFLTLKVYDVTVPGLEVQDLVPALSLYIM